MLSPDYVKLAEAYGIPGYSASLSSEVDNVLKKMFATEGPVIVEFKVVKEEMVFPMVPSGASISDMILERLNPKRMV